MAKAVNNRKLVIFSVLAYVVFLLAMFPLNVIYKLVDPKGLPAQVIAVSGTLWDGEVVMKHDMTGQIKASWQLSVLPLLWGAAHTSVNVSSAELNGQFIAQFNPLTEKVSISELNAYINAAFINKVASRSKVKLNGNVEITNVSIKYDLSKTFTEYAAGRAVWFGGLVSYPKGRKTGSATLPMLIADIDHQSGELKVNVHTDENLSVVTANLKTDGWGSVAVLKRMIDLAGEPWPSKASPDTAVFEVSEKVF